jgi:hypothetical protein
MFSAENSKGRYGFDASYLNPIIFYRAVEEEMGSPDNALIGLNLNIIPFRKVRIYGQLMMDEFLLKHLRAMDNNWTNKYALQAGLKYINVFGINNLDFQGEFNLIRPYTYSHDTISNTYSHYNQSLAHPLGANLVEKIIILKYNPIGRLNISLKLMHIVQGKDTGKYDFGGNILLDYHQRYRVPGDKAYLLQGLRTINQQAELLVSYMIWHNLFLDGQVIISSEKNSLINQSLFYTGGSLRLNFAIPKYQY